ncbi:hypothetical protein EII34_09645 [Arachnia propionica]|uniref:Uncharacterized protein n=1 Tax=Arachnia propionica TaxID=1750 RepID=A0A3P1T5C6_9ACTN|nr:hypothetical protein [Arachnia propionica]RRD04560.1 hypothetical protein EII34_09645 [Arachnia propionica]
MKHATAFLTALLALLALLAPRAALAAPGQEEKLPDPPPAPANVPNFGTTVRPDGTPVAVVVASGIGGMLNVIDLATGKTTTSKPLSNQDIDVQAWGFARMPDDSLLIGSAHHLFRYDPTGDEVTQLSVEGAPGWKDVDARFESIWDIAVDDSGTAYLATNAKNGGAHVLTWRADRGWGLLPGGAPVSEAQYAQSIDHADGHVYVGTGPTTPQVIRINVSTGARTVLPVLTGQPQSGTHEHLEVHGGWLYTNKIGSYGGVAYNLTTGARQDLDTYGKHVVTRPGDPTKVYFTHIGEHSGGWLYSYDPTTGTREAVLHDPSLRGRLSPLSWATTDIFTSNEMTNGEFSIAHIPAGRVTVRDDQVVSRARAVQSMTAAANGKLYASWYMTSKGLLEITPGATADATSYGHHDGPVAQAESMASDGEWLATGLYPGGKVHIESLDDATKTKDIAIGHRQDRPYAALSLGNGDFAFGSVPGYGQLGGALSIYDRATGGLETYPFVASSTYAPGVDGSQIAKLSPVSLARIGNTIYMGTSTRGGHQTFAETREAYVVEFDLGKRKVTRITRVLDQQVAVTGLTVGADGVLYGITGQHVFKMVDGRIEAQALTNRAGEFNRSWLLEQGGVLYAVVGGQLWRIPTGRFGDAEVVVGVGRGDHWVACLTLGHDGYLYYSKGAELFRHSVTRG